jgi:hypothetical protein
MGEAHMCYLAALFACRAYCTHATHTLEARPVLMSAQLQPLYASLSQAISTVGNMECHVITAIHVCVQTRHGGQRSGRVPRQPIGARR